MCREHASTITNAHTVRRRPVRGSSHIPSGRSRSAPADPGGGQSRSTVTWARRASSGRFARTHRRTLATRRVQTRLVDQTLVDRRRRHPRLELGGDVVAVRLDPRPGHLPQPGVAQLREPARHQPAPVAPRPSAGHPARSPPPGPGRCTCAGSCGPPPSSPPAHAATGPHTSGSKSPQYRSLRRSSSPQWLHPRCSATRRTLASTEDQTRHRHARRPLEEFRDRRLGELRDRQPLTLGELLDR